MRQVRIDDFVRLRQNIPELSLFRGDIGIVRSTWFAPTVAYEVEFHHIGQEQQTRVLVQPEQVELEKETLLPEADLDSDAEALLGWG